MIVSEKKLENARMELEIEVPEDQVEDEYVKVFNKLQKNVKIDGFRKGKVPIDIIQKRFKGNADTEVAENIIMASYINALKERNLSPINQPEFEFDKIERAKIFKFNVRFDISPTVELSNYKNLSVKENTYKLNNSDIDKEILSLRERYATVTKKEKGEKAEKGNYVRAEIKRIDNVDQDEIENIKSQEISLIVGKYNSDVSFDEDIIGMKVDDKKEVIKKYPKDYSEKDLAGQKVKYSIKIIEISNLALPDLDDEFAKDLGDYSSVEDVKKKVREDMEKYIKEKGIRNVKNELIKIVVENSKFDLPESMINREMDNLLEKFKNSMGLQNKGVDELFDKGILEKEKFLTEIRDDAVRNIKSTLVLLEIAKAENLKASEDKYKEFVKSYAENNNTDVNETEKKIEETGIKGSIETELVLTASSDFLYNNASIKKHNISSFEEFVKY